MTSAPLPPEPATTAGPPDGTSPGPVDSGGLSGPTESEWDAAAEVLGKAQDVALVCHVAPDGDALGSMIALGLALRSLGKHVVASWAGDPPRVPDNYASLPGRDLLVPAEQIPAAPELLVALDTGSLDRLGALADRAAAADSVLVIDHHATSTLFGTTNLVDPEAAATGQLVAGLLDRLGVPLSHDVAISLYTAIVTDTGLFRYAATSPAVHTLVARLLSAGIPHARIVREIYDTAPLAYVHLLGEACARACLEPHAANGRGMVWTDVRQDELVRSGLELSDLEGIIDVLRTAQEAEVSAVIKEESGGTLRVSVRSKGAVDVGTVCAALGGGGHRLAAGFSSDLDVPGTVAALRRQLEERAPGVR